MNNSSPRLGALLVSAGLAGTAAVVGTITYAKLHSDPIHFSARDIPASMRQTNLIAANIGHGSGSAKGEPTLVAPADPGDNAKIALVTERLLTEDNYVQHPLDKVISERLFDRYLNALDPQHLFFLQSDLDEWKPLRDVVAEKIKENGDTSFSETALTRYKERLAAQVAFVQDALKTRTFTFTDSDTIQIDRKDAARPADLEEAKKLWWQQLRFEYLQELLNKKKPDDIVKTLSKRYARTAKSVDGLGSDRTFEIYLKTLCFAFDPHSEYFGKASSEEFAILMNASLFGIGAQLQSDDGYVTIHELIPGGPASKSKELKVGDKIVGVAQGASGGDVVDVVDNMSLDKVVQMIRGDKGTKVRLLIQPAGADPTVRRTVMLTRDQVKLTDSLAKAQLIQLPSPRPGGAPVRLGVIALPSFYGEPGAPHHTTSDIRLLIDKLKEQHVSGIVLDLRNNGGGSLDEAAGCAGLFVGHGPVVQTRESNGHVNVKESPDTEADYAGPLIVLTNRLSASASEIVTGALHDYGRALVVGDTRTYGKSTVQDQLPLADIMARVPITVSSDPGSIHLTIAKYYLPSGHSVQLIGVPSDIVIPAATNILKVGEAFSLNPLPTDSISAAKFTNLNRYQPYLPSLQAMSSQRVATNADFTYLQTEIARLKKTMDEKTLSLNLATREKERTGANARLEARKKVLAARPAPKETVWSISVADAEKPGLPAPLKPGKNADAVTPPTGDEDPALDDATSGAAAKAGPTERDMSLDETERILIDYIGMGKK